MPKRKTSTEGEELNLSRLVGIEVSKEAAHSSDVAIREAFRIAARQKVNLRLMRLGGPREFRREVIEYATRGRALTPAIKALLDDRIPQIEFLLSNPASNAFLSRMDSEHKPSRDIWRVREEVIGFACGLLEASRIREKQGLSPIVVAFHSKPLLWNLCVVGEGHVVMHAYYGGASGHDNRIANLCLSFGSEARLAESMAAYYESVRSDPATRFLLQDSDREKLGNWPSLFKGNAVWPDECENGAVIKVVPTAMIRDTEADWHDVGHSKSQWRWFKPARILDRRPSNERCFGGFGLRVEKLVGVTAEDLVCYLQRGAAEHDELRLKAEIMVGEIATQALAALQEFREVWKTLPNSHGLKVRARSYPWKQQLLAAIKEAAPFVTYDEALRDQCRQELEALAPELEAAAHFPFRDAHLKNRIVGFDPLWFQQGDDSFWRWLAATPVDALSEWLCLHTRDIDFETGRFLVTSWDDPLHVLCSPNLGFTCSNLLADGCRLINEWWPSGTDETGLIDCTLLARSIRELCRRIWYASVMPDTFRHRYQMEGHHHFLVIAREVARRVPNCSALEELLEVCWTRREAIWPAPMHEERDDVLRAIPRPVVAVKKSHPPVACPVFISYSRQDVAAAEEIVQQLRAQRIAVYRDERHIPGGASWRDELVAAIKSCQVVLVLVTRNSAASKEVPTELDIAKQAKKTLIPLRLEEIPELEAGGLTYFLAGKQRIDYFGAPPALLIDRLVEALVTHGVQP